MIDEALIEQLNRGYVCPPALTKSPEERLEEHQRALDMMLLIRDDIEHNAPK